MADFTNQDVTNLALAGNEIAMGWYSLITGHPLPQQPISSGINISPTGVQVGAGPLVAVAVIIVALLVLAK